ncbi:MAG: S9 family peptidase [FCB group bacterium]|nr:S9 family peptidase [FCB group bacterium]MBL7027108.1 S9 family peptidase [Candidatus Neomarinimicrobiota bacterium]MBL7122422.1 S9 family peptidase [Candidatus Neomarinimicrobiota bacterium]
MNKNKLVIGLFALVIVTCIPKSESVPDMNDTDPYIWLEEVEGENALNWVREQNTVTLNELQADPRFQQFESEALAIYEAKDRTVYGKIRADYIYNFWRDDVHIRGIWRRSPLDAYLENKPEWDVLLDIDALAEAEEENWVYKSVNGLPPNYNRFLIELSRGGKDAVVVREFDVSTRSFLDDGFFVSEEKSAISWINENQVFVATNFGMGSMTSSGYPASVRVWTRGEDLATSPEITRVATDNVGLWGWTIFTTDNNYSLISKSKDFWTHEILLLDEVMGTKKIELPVDADLKGLWKEQAFAILRSDWLGSSKGSLIALDLTSNTKMDVFIPNAKSSIMDVNFSSTHLLLTIQEDVVDKVLRGVRHENSWVLEDLGLPQGGTISIKGTDPLNANFFYTYNDLITPSTLGYFEDAMADPKVIRQSPARYDSDNLEVNQKFATSKDGTKIPYFLVSRKDMPFDGSNPTLLYGYGGFEVSEKSQYWSKTGKLWMEKGGVLALANIRGGGEYGPAWHQAALKTNRHKSYEDFIAIAEQLISTKITSPEKLGIMGGSGGGLLVGVVFTMRPDLFNAVVSQVPLLDMLRYHKLLAGASWMGEYGDPDDPVEGAYLKEYSPYHSLSPGKKYPKPMFTTSTKDDRVHPGHARKMVARMKEQGHPVMYYENIEGGHAAGANLKQYATRAAIEFTYLHRMLMD